MTKEEFLKEAGNARMGKLNTVDDCPHCYGMEDCAKDFRCTNYTGCRGCWDEAVTKAEIKFKEECVNE